jgi:cytochrome c
MRSIALLTLAGLFSASTALAAEGDPAAGQGAYEARCGNCHSLDPGVKKQSAPLAGVLGRKAGTVEGYKYSEALKSSGLIFDEATLETYLAAPRQKVPGTSMMVGVSDPKIRADIIAYLMRYGR